jgi:NADH-quinone oxidoreductase subunit A
MLAIVVTFAVFGLLGVALLFVNALLGPKRTNPAKETPFECGSPPLQKGIRPFPIKFTLVAFIFLLFDVEAAFFFPLALVVKTVKGPALAALIVYAAVIAAGFAFAWRKGAFEWE